MLSTSTLLNNRYRVRRLFKEGGFSLIYEVIDTKQFNVQNAFGLLPCRAIKLLKVFNFSGSSQQDAEAFFRREIALLKRLNHSQIVKYLDDFDYLGERGVFPCVVLEKVQGTTLDDYLSQQVHIPEGQILDWLTQCADILDYLHNEQRVMHLDIKPSNIMVRPTGELVFIDFGIARPISQTLLAKLVDSGEPQNRRAGTNWYMPPEQSQGKPIGQSDIYALGRTMVQALANRPIKQVAEDDEGGWLWAEIAPHISLELKQLLEDMTHYSISYRLVDAVALKQRVDHIIATYFPDRRPLLVRQLSSATTLALSSLTITGLVIGGRSLGLLQPLELQFFDHTLWMRSKLVSLVPYEARPQIYQADQNITIIAVKDRERPNSHLEARSSDIDFQRQYHAENNYPEMPADISLSDEVLKDLVERVQQYRPLAIGIDILLRDITNIRDKSNIVGICSHGDWVSGNFQRPPTKGVLLENIGAVDVDSDPSILQSNSDEIKQGERSPPVRRQQILRGDTEGCPTFRSLAYQLLLYYARAQNWSVEDKDSQPVINGYRYPSLERDDFFYAKPFYPKDGKDIPHELLIDYRAYSTVSKDVLSIQDLLNPTYSNRLSEQEMHALFDGKIVLIGSLRELDDTHKTPYGMLPGVFLQAHELSHLIDMASGRRQPLRYWSKTQSIPWILGWSIAYGLLIFPLRGSGKIIYRLLIASCVLYLICIVGIFYAWCLTFVPVVAAYAIHSAIAIKFPRTYIKRWKFRHA